MSKKYYLIRVSIKEIQPAYEEHYPNRQPVKHPGHERDIVDIKLTGEIAKEAITKAIKQLTLEAEGYPHGQ